MNNRIERNNVICFDPHLGKRQPEIEALRATAQREIDDYHHTETMKRIAVYLGIATFCTLFWGGILWLATK